MKITVIDNTEQFEKIKADWDAAYSADPNATVFLSWGCIRGWIESTTYNWFIIAIKPNDTSQYVAFMPVCTRSIRKNRFNFTHNLFMAGGPFADHTGFVCLPAFAEKAIPTFARLIQKEFKFDTFYMRYVFDPRLDLFLKCFSSKKYEVQELDGTPCPYILLPDNWDKYLEEFLGTSTRRSLKYDTRKIQNLNEFRMTQVHAGNLETQIESLLTLWQSRWGFNSESVLSGLKIEDNLNSKRSIFRHCFENNCLWLNILWVGSTPIAGLAAIADSQKKIFNALIIAVIVDDKFTKLSPGTVMFGYSIRYAIENGFKIYDFGARDEKYKLSFGTKVRFNKNIIVKRKTFLMRFKDRVPVKLKILRKTLLSRTLKETNNSIL